MLASVSDARSYTFLTIEESLCLNILSYLMLILRNTANGTLPSSPYNAVRVVDFLKSSTSRKNLVCTDSILVTSCVPQISA